MIEQDLILTPYELSILKSSEWIEGKWYYNPYEAMRTQLAKIKEAGWLNSGEFGTPKARHEWAIANGYVQLVENETLPRNPHLGLPVFYALWKEAQQDMLTIRAGVSFRKVKLEAEPS